MRQVPEVEYAFTLQEDLHSMHKWSHDWQLLFNFTQNKCLHIGYNNPNCDYFMGDVRIEPIDIEKELGVHHLGPTHLRKLPSDMVPTSSERYRQIRKCPEEGH